MEELFSGKFLDESRGELYTVYKVEENLFQARSNQLVIILWKVKNSWEGAGNIEASALIHQIGDSIDAYYSKRVWDRELG